MSGPWQNYGAPAPTTGGSGPWQTYGSPPPPASGSGTVLPFSWDQSGVRFDPNAGILGAAKDFFTYPGDAAAGKVDPLSDQGIARNLNFAGFASGMSPASAWVRQPKVAVPSSADLKTEGGAQRNLARSMGVVYSNDAVVGLATKAQADLLQKGWGPKVATQTNAVLDDLKAFSDDPTAQRDFSTAVEAARNNLQAIAQGASDAQERGAASRAISALDQFIKRPDPGSVVAGPAAALGEVFADANSNYAAGSRSQTLEAIAKRSANRASASNSGLNLDNSIRGRVASFIQPSPNGGPSVAERSGFQPNEIQLLQDIVDGKKGANALRTVANLLGGGGGLGALATGGLSGAAGSMATGSPAGALLGVIPPAIGLGAKIAENSITRRALANAAEQLRTRSAMFGDRQAATPLMPVNAAQRTAIIRTLMLGLAPRQSALPAQPPPLLPYTSSAPLRSTTGQMIPAGTRIY